jgi:hypothetical protein
MNLSGTSMLAGYFVNHHEIKVENNCPIINFFFNDVLFVYIYLVPGSDCNFGHGTRQFYFQFANFPLNL